MVLVSEFYGTTNLNIPKRILSDILIYPSVRIQENKNMLQGRFASVWDDFLYSFLTNAVVEGQNLRYNKHFASDTENMSYAHKRHPERPTPLFGLKCIRQVEVPRYTVTNNSSFQNYPHPDDHTILATDTPGFKSFTSVYCYYSKYQL